MCKFNISEKSDHILVVTRGNIKNEDVKNIHRIATQKARDHGVVSVLIDNRKLLKISGGLQRAMEVSRSVDKRCEGNITLKFAVVANQENFADAAFCGPVFSSDCKEFKAFTNLDEAKEWLGIEPG